MDVKSFFVRQIAHLVLGVRVEETEDAVIIHAKSAKIANAILADIRKRAERENNLEPLKLIKVVLDP